MSDELDNLIKRLAAAMGEPEWRVRLHIDNVLVPPSQTPYEYDRIAAYIEDYFRQQSSRLEWRVDRYADRVNIERDFPRTYEITSYLRVADETFGCHFSLDSWQFRVSANGDDLLNHIKHRMAVLLAEEIMKS